MKKTQKSRTVKKEPQRERKRGKERERERKYDTIKDTVDVIKHQKLSEESN